MDHEPPFGTLHQIALPCADLERGVAFYRDLLGLPFIARFDPPGLAFFELGPVRLLLERVPDASAGHSVLYLRVPDIQESYESLRSRGVVFVAEPHLIHTDDAGDFGEAGEQEWMAFFDDPDGNHLALAWRGAGREAG